jgi:hypothetical protein
MPPRFHPICFGRPGPIIKSLVRDGGPSAAASVRVRPGQSGRPLLFMLEPVLHEHLGGPRRPRRRRPFLLGAGQAPRAK